MLTFLTVLFIIVAVLLILLVLVQDPKGGSGGMFGGGGSNSLLGSAGAPSFLSKLTRNLAILFGVLCIVLTIVLKPRDSGLLDKFEAPAATNAPATTETPAAAAPVSPETAPNNTETQKPVETKTK